MPDFFQTVQDRRAKAFDELDRKTFEPLIRNHLVQLFRAAHAVQPQLTGAIVGMGGAIPRGQYLSRGDKEPGAHPEDGPRMWDACEWDADRGAMYHAAFPAVEAWLQAVRDYDQSLAHDLACDDITPADLVTTRAKKAAIHGPRGSRVRGR